MTTNSQSQEETGVIFDFIRDELDLSLLGESSKTLPEFLDELSDRINAGDFPLVPAEPETSTPFRVGTLYALDEDAPEFSKNFISDFHGNYLPWVINHFRDSIDHNLEIPSKFKDIFKAIDEFVTYLSDPDFEVFQTEDISDFPSERLLYGKKLLIGKGGTKFDARIGLVRTDLDYYLVYLYDRGVCIYKHSLKEDIRRGSAIGLTLEYGDSEDPWKGKIILNSGSEPFELVF